MIPDNIKIKNYKSYGDEETVIDLSGNSVKLVYGNIGAGKTTFVDGIIWCLYGESLVNIDEVINRKNKKNCKVEFNFYIKDDYYSITRYRKHEEYGDEVVVFKNHRNISPVKKKDSQELINSIVGMNHKAVISSVMFSSEIYISFLRVKEAKRLEVLDSVLNMNVFKKWNDTTRKMRAPVEEGYEVAVKQIEKLEYGRETLENSIQEYKDNSKKQLFKLKKEKEELLGSIQRLKNELDEYERIDWEKEIETCENHKKVSDNNGPIKKDIDVLKKSLASIGKELNNASEDYGKKTEELKRVSNIDFNKEMKKRESWASNMEKAQEIKALERGLSSLASIEREISKLDKEINSIDSDMAKTKESVCYTCGHVLDKEKTDSFILKLEDKKKKLLENIDRLEKEFNNTDLENTRIIQEIDVLKSEMINIDGMVLDEKELFDLRTKEQRLKTEISSLEKDIVRFQSEEKKYREELKRKEGVLLEDVPSSRYTLEFLKELKEEKLKKELEISKAKDSVESINKQAKTVYSKEYVEGLEEKITKVNSMIEQVEKTRKEKAEELKYYNYLMKILSNKDYGIKKYIISKMIDIFNKNVNKYIPLFFDRDIKVEFDKNLKDTIYENKQEINFNSFSSGEKSLLDISIAFSLYMLVKDFFSSDIRFLVFDEILDRNVDEEGIQSILQVINELAKDNSIMVISHRAELQESFERKIHVYKEDGFSKVEIF